MKESRLSAYTIRVDSSTLKSFRLPLSRKYFAKIDDIVDHKEQSGRI